MARASGTSSSPVIPARARPRSPSTSFMPPAPLTRLGQGRRRDRRPRLRARGAQTEAVPVARRSPRWTTDGHEITIVDTPGYADFAGEVVEGFEAVDAALFTMDASGGVEAGTERAISLGREHGTAGTLRHHPLRARERRPHRRAGRPARRRSATRSRRFSWPSARPTRSRATSTSCIARRTCGRAARRLRQRFPPS